MNTGNLKNIVVLKDLPSNLVEEAIVVLKENQKIPKLEPASTDKKENQSIQKLNKKCKRLKTVNQALLVGLAISLLINFIF